MAVTFKVGKSFIDFISINGFEQKQVDSEKHYYVNSKGNQIKIDNEKGIITLLNKYGNVVHIVQALKGFKNYKEAYNYLAK